MNKIFTSLRGFAHAVYLGFVLFFSILFLFNILRQRPVMPQFLRLRERIVE